MQSVTILFLVVQLYVLNLSYAKIQVKSIKPCEIPKNDIQKGFTFDLQYNGDAGTVNVKMVTPFTIDDDIEFEVTAEKMVDGKLVPDDFNLQGSLCDSVAMYLPDVATALTKALKREELCPIPAGEYKLENFGISESEANLPEVEAGLHYIAKIVYKKGPTPVMCFNYEIVTV